MGSSCSRSLTSAPDRNHDLALVPCWDDVRPKESSVGFSLSSEERRHDDQGTISDDDIRSPPLVLADSRNSNTLSETCEGWRHIRVRVLPTPQDSNSSDEASSQLGTNTPNISLASCRRLDSTDTNRSQPQRQPVVAFTNSVVVFCEHPLPPPPSPTIVSIATPGSAIDNNGLAVALLELSCAELSVSAERFSITDHIAIDEHREAPWNCFTSCSISPLNDDECVLDDGNDDEYHDELIECNALQNAVDEKGSPHAAPFVSPLSAFQTEPLIDQASTRCAPRRTSIRK